MNKRFGRSLADTLTADARMCQLESEADDDFVPGYDRIAPIADDDNTQVAIDDDFVPGYDIPVFNDAHACISDWDD